MSARPAARGGGLGFLVAAVLGAVVSVASLATPWSRLGAVRRSGFGLLSAARAAGLATSGWDGALTALVDVLPALAALAATAALLGRRQAACVLAACTGAVVAAASVLALSTSAIGPQFGPWLGAVFGMATVGVGAGAFALGRQSGRQRERRHEPRR